VEKFHLDFAVECSAAAHFQRRAEVQTDTMARVYDARSSARRPVPSISVKSDRKSSGPRRSLQSSRIQPWQDLPAAQDSFSANGCRMCSGDSFRPCQSIEHSTISDKQHSIDNC